MKIQKIRNNHIETNKLNRIDFEKKNNNQKSCIHVFSIDSSNFTKKTNILKTQKKTIDRISKNSIVFFE